MNTQVTQKRWPPIPQTRWPILGASICFAIGALCILVFFMWNPTQGWGPPVLFIYGPLLFGILGMIFGFISQRWYLIVLNVLCSMCYRHLCFQ